MLREQMIFLTVLAIYGTLSFFFGYFVSFLIFRANNKRGES